MSEEGKAAPKEVDSDDKEEGESNWGRSSHPDETPMSKETLDWLLTRR